MPQLGEIERFLHALPNDDRTLEYIGNPTHLQDFGMIIAEQAFASSNDAARDCFAADLESKCHTIFHNDQEVIEEPSEPSSEQGKKPACNTIGICIRKGHGLIAWECRNGFLKQMKLVLRGDALHEDVDACRVFGCLLGEDPYATTDEVQAELNALMGRHPRGSQTWWFCLGAHSWNPYRPCFKIYQESAAKRECNHDDEIHLQAA